MIAEHIEHIDRGVCVLCVNRKERRRKNRASNDWLTFVYIVSAANWRSYACMNPPSRNRCRNYPPPRDYVEHIDRGVCVPHVDRFNTSLLDHGTSGSMPALAAVFSRYICLHVQSHFDRGAKLFHTRLYHLDHGPRRL